MSVGVAVCRLGNCRAGSQLALIYCLILQLSEFLLDIGYCSVASILLFFSLIFINVL